MKIKFKNKEEVKYGYKIKCLTSNALVGNEGPFTHLELSFNNSENEVIIPFDVRGNNLFMKISIRKMAKNLKNKNIFECLQEIIKFVNQKHTIMGTAYQSIIENVPTSLHFESEETLEEMLKLYALIPSKYKYMAMMGRKEKEQRMERYKNITETDNVEA